MKLTKKYHLEDHLEDYWSTNLALPTSTFSDTMAGVLFELFLSFGILAIAPCNKLTLYFCSLNETLCFCIKKCV